MRSGFLSGRRSELVPVLDWQRHLDESVLHGRQADLVLSSVLIGECNTLKDCALLYLPSRTWFWQAVADSRLMCWRELTEALVGVVQYRGNMHPAFELERLAAQLRSSYDVSVEDGESVLDQALSSLLDLRLDDVQGAPFYLI